MALDGIGSLIENELKLLIEKCLADYAEKEQEKNENSPWFTSYVRNAPEIKKWLCVGIFLEESPGRTNQSCKSTKL